ncbi:MAG: putative metal-binding motif-containing protein [Myxococcaceae bacterium]|nr:putative metal-binding motif-containing protein [Myxococcaceae bacterium]
MRAAFVIVLGLSACEARTDLFPRGASGGPGAPLAADCRQVPGLDPEGSVAVTLHASPDASFSAWCSGDGGTWLVLRQPGDANVSRIVADGEWLGTTVETRFEAIRVERSDDGGGLYDVVKTDLTFSRSTGRVWNLAGDFDVTGAPYLSPSDCVVPGSASASARGDLRGTPFAFVPGGLRITGYQPGGAITFSAWNQVVEVVAGGYCGGIAGDGPLQLRLCVAPGPETCDGADNDCNGVVDDTATPCP